MKLSMLLALDHIKIVGTNQAPASAVEAENIIVNASLLFLQKIIMRSSRDVSDPSSTNINIEFECSLRC